MMPLKSSNKLVLKLFIVAGLLSIGGLLYWSKLSIYNGPPILGITGALRGDSPLPKELIQSGVSHSKENIEYWTQLISQESERIGRITEIPDQEFQRIKLIALEIPEKFIPQMAALALNPAFPSDERLMAIELLTYMNHEASLDGLLKVALEPIPAQTEVKSVNQEERALRASAVEAFYAKRDMNRAHRSLEEIIEKTEDSFLKDRAQRTLLAVEGKAPSPEEQDRAALEKVLSK